MNYKKLFLETLLVNCNVFNSCRYLPLNLGYILVFSDICLVGTESLGRNTSSSASLSVLSKASCNSSAKHKPFLNSNNISLEEDSTTVETRHLSVASSSGKDGRESDGKIDVYGGVIVF
jgi:hypothetical protein